MLKIISSLVTCFDFLIWWTLGKFMGQSLIYLDWNYLFNISPSFVFIVLYFLSFRSQSQLIMLKVRNEVLRKTANPLGNEQYPLSSSDIAIGIFNLFIALGIDSYWSRADYSVDDKAPTAITISSFSRSIWFVLSS